MKNLINFLKKDAEEGYIIIVALYIVAFIMFFINSDVLSCHHVVLWGSLVLIGAPAAIIWRIEGAYAEDLHTLLFCSAIYLIILTGIWLSPIHIGWSFIPIWFIGTINAPLCCELDESGSSNCNWTIALIIAFIATVVLTSC